MKQIDLAQGTVCYEEHGAGDPVVFVHGLLVDGSLWNGVVGELQATHRCIVPTWPLGSHTLPMFEDADLSPAGAARLVADFLAALDLRDVTLVGNDTGGAISQIVAARHPERIGRLVLTNCDALEVFPPPEFKPLTMLPRVPGLFATTAKALLHSEALRRRPTAYGALTREPIDDALLRRWIEPSANDGRIRRDAAKLLRGMSPEITQAVARELRHFDKPALLLWGDADPFFRLELAQRLANCFPLATLSIIDGARTFLPLDAPVAVAQNIRDFISANRPAPRTAVTHAAADID